MVVIIEIVDAAQIETRRTLFANFVRRLIEQLSSKDQLIGDLSLQQPTGEPIVLVPRARIDPVTAAAIGRPRAEFLLHPDRQEHARRSRAETPTGVADRDLDQGKYGDLGAPVVLAGIDD